MSELDRPRRGFARIAIAVLAVTAGLLAAPASASAFKHAAAGASASKHPTTVKHPAVIAAAAKHKGSWKWTAKFDLGHVTGLKKKVEYGNYGLACPTTHLCIVPMDGTSTTHPDTPAGDFYSTNPEKGKGSWKFSRWSEDYAPGDTLSVDNISCAPAGSRSDCNIVGREPVAGSSTESYGATVFQTGTPTAKDWGAALVDGASPGFGAVSCFVNVQCAEIDDQGSIFTTAGASVTSDVSVFPADKDVAGTWWIGCAQHLPGQNNFFCAAVDDNGAGTIAWTVNPGQPDTKWTKANLGHHAELFHVACFRPGVCIINNNGQLIVTRGDTKKKSWVHGFKKVTLPKHVGKTVQTLDCNEKLCAVAGTSTKLGQYVAISTNPHGHWNVIPLSKKHKIVLNDGISNVSCPTVTMCAVTNGYGQITTGHK